MKIRLRSTTRLTQKGMIGATMFVVGPIVLAISALVMLRASPLDSRGSLLEWGLISLAGMVLFLVGYILLSTGKETVSDAVSGDDF